MNKISLQLYVIGPSVFSRIAIEHVQEMIRQHPEHQFQLDIIDVLEHPESAELNKIIATPTLIRTDRAPNCRVVGDMSNRQRLRELLGLNHVQRPPEKNQPG